MCMYNLIWQYSSDVRRHTDILLLGHCESMIIYWSLHSSCLLPSIFPQLTFLQQQSRILFMCIMCIVSSSPTSDTELRPLYLHTLPSYDLIAVFAQDCSSILPHTPSRQRLHTNPLGWHRSAVRMLGSKDDDGSLVSLTSNDNTWIPSIGKENGTTSRSRGKLSSSKLVWRLTIYVRVCVSVPLLRKTYANECLK